MARACARQAERVRHRFVPTPSRWALAPRMDGSDSSARATSRRSFLSAASPHRASKSDTIQPGPSTPRILMSWNPAASSSERVLRAMKVGGREVVSVVRVVAVLTVGNVPVPDPYEPRIQGQLPGQAIERGGVPRDGGDDHDTERRENPEGLSQRRKSVGGGRQMVERPHHQDGRGPTVAARQAPSVGDGQGRDGPRQRRVVPACLFDEAQRRVDQCMSYPCSASHAEYAPAAPPTSTIRAGGAGSTRTRTSFVRSNSRREVPTERRDSSGN